MPEMQTTYSETVAPGYPGMVASGENSNRITRTVEAAAGIAFGKGAFDGAGDHGCLPTQTLTATSAVLGTNTGNGAMGAITVSAGAKPGGYTLTIIEPAADAGSFTVEDPEGVQVGDGTVGVAYSAGGLAFTLADGATDFAAGDSFRLSVSGGEFLGIVIGNSAQPILAGGAADAYAQYENVPIMTHGAIYVELGGTVAKRQDASIDANGNFIGDGTGIACPGWQFDEGGGEGDIVVVVRR